MTIGRLLELGAAYLRRHHVPEDEVMTQAELLLSEELGWRGPRLHLEAERVVSDEVVARLRQKFVRVAQGEPIQYVLGRWSFHAIELKTDSRALIPRPETEQLVERILQSEVWERAETVVDIGTGTGAIILALAAACERVTPGRIRFVAVDLSEAALSLARENAEALGLSHRITFLHGNGARGLAPNSCDILVSNPPYIPTAVVDGLPALIREHEPRLALDGGVDGLDVLRQILLDATQSLRSGGRVFFEIGDEQGLSMRRLLECAGYTEVVIGKDYAGHDRYAEGSLS